MAVSSAAAQEKASYSPSARAGQVRLEGLDSLPRGISREHGGERRPQLALAVLALPLLVALLTGAVTRSRVALTRRIA